MKLRKYYRVNRKGQVVGSHMLRPDQIAKLHADNPDGDKLMRHPPKQTK